MPKHVVDFYVINNTYLFHLIVVLDIRNVPILAYKDTKAMTNHIIWKVVRISKTSLLCCYDKNHRSIDKSKYYQEWGVSIWMHLFLLFNPLESHPILLFPSQGFCRWIMSRDNHNTWHGNGANFMGLSSGNCFSSRGLWANENGEFGCRLLRDVSSFHLREHLATPCGVLKDP